MACESAFSDGVGGAGMSAAPSWSERHKSLCAKCGGGLTLMGLDGVEIGVYIYLFHRLVAPGNSAISAPTIEHELNSIQSYLPEEHRKNYTPNTVGTAVKRLVSLGLVEAIAAPGRRKSAGRPAKTYKAVAVATARRSLENAFDDYKKEVLRSFGPLEQLEEARSIAEDKFPEEDRQ